MCRHVAHHCRQDRAKLHFRKDVLRTLSRYGLVFETQSREEGSFEKPTEEGSPGLNIP